MLIDGKTPAQWLDKAIEQAEKDFCQRHYCMFLANQIALWSGEPVDNTWMQKELPCPDCERVYTASHAEV